MFSKKSLHVTLAFVLLIGLAAMGLVYGAWSEKLVVNGSVETGEFDVEFADAIVTKTDSSYADCSATYDTDRNIMTFDLVDAFPGYWCKARVLVTNKGTVPASLAEADVKFLDASGNPLEDFNIGGAEFLPITILPTQTGEIGWIQFTAQTDAEYNQTYTGKVEITFRQATP